MWERGYLVGRIREKVEPVLGLVECLGEEDEIGAVGRGGLDVHAAQPDVLGVNALGLWMGEEILPRMCWMEEKQHAFDNCTSFRILSYNYLNSPPHPHTKIKWEYTHT